MITYPGLPGPVISDHVTFEDSRTHYATGTEFHIGRIEMVANTGTYLDTPAHRWKGGADLSTVPLDRLAGLPGVAIRSKGPELTPDLITDTDVSGAAVLFNTGWDRHWRTDAYGNPRSPVRGSRSGRCPGDRQCRVGRNRRRQHRFHDWGRSSGTFPSAGSRDSGGGAPHSTRPTARRRVRVLCGAGESPRAGDIPGPGIRQMVMIGRDQN